MNKFKQLDITEQSRRLCYAALSGLNHLELERIRLNKKRLSMAMINKTLSAWMFRGIKKKLWECDVTNSQFENLINHNKQFPLTLSLSHHFKFLVDHHFLHTRVNKFIDPMADVYQLLLKSYAYLEEQGHKVIIGMPLKKGNYCPTAKHEFFCMEVDIANCVFDNRLVKRMAIYVTGESSQIFIDACYQFGLIPVRSNISNSSAGKEVSARFLIYPHNACVDSPLEIIGLTYIRPTIIDKIDAT